MKLHFQRLGQGQPLVILHGLFGTLENWGTTTKALAEHFDVIAVDLRNHGRSPHAAEMNYPVMATDVIKLLDDLNLPSVLLMGHSMGGKVAMQIALNHPERIQKLLLVDIAPVAYEHHHLDVFKGLNSVDLESLKSRSEAESVLTHYISEASVRAFLLKNLYRTPEKKFAWRMNLPVLDQQYAHISQAPKGSVFSGTTMFIKGGNSHYIEAKHREAILALFPNATYKVIQGAGHWPHAEKPELFTKLVINFLSANT